MRKTYFQSRQVHALPTLELRTNEAASFSNPNLIDTKTKPLLKRDMPEED